MDPRKHYKILEIDRSASLEEARQAYRDLIAVWHPDRYTHNPRLQQKALEKVKAVNVAFEIVSRCIIENKSGKKHQPETNSRPVRTASRGKNKDRETGGRQAVWEKTEARLAALARAKKLAQAREAARSRETNKIEAAQKKEGPASLKGRLKAENRARALEKEKAEKVHLEKKLARERAWAETEQKLRALKLAREKAELARSANPGNREASGAPFGWYVKQILICSGILLAAFSGNALQTFIHIQFAMMLVMAGGGLLAWSVVAKLKRSSRRKKR